MSDSSSSSTSSSPHDEQAFELDDIGTRLTDSDDAGNAIDTGSTSFASTKSTRKKRPILFIIVASLFTLSSVLFAVSCIISMSSSIDFYTNKAVARQRVIDDFNIRVTDWETTARPAVVSAITALGSLDAHFTTFLATINGGTLSSSLNFSIVTTATEDEQIMNVTEWTLPTDERAPLTPVPYHLRAIHRFGALTFEDPSTTDCAVGVRAIGSAAPFETEPRPAFSTSVQEIAGVGLTGKADNAIERCESMGGFYTTSASVLDCQFRRYLLSICFVVDFETGELSSIEGAPTDSHGCWAYKFDPDTPEYTEELYGMKKASDGIPSWSEFEVWVELRDRRDPVLGLNAMTKGRTGSEKLFGEDGEPYRRSGMWTAVAAGCSGFCAVVFGLMALCNWVRVILKCRK